MKTIFKALLCLLLLFAFSCGGGEKKPNETPDGSVDESVEESMEEGDDYGFEVEDSYKCPMDCEDGIEYSEEGACPECGMELKHVDEEAHNDSEGHEEEDEEEHEDESKTENELRERKE